MTNRFPGGFSTEELLLREEQNRVVTLNRDPLLHLEGRRDLEVVDSTRARLLRSWEREIAFQRDRLRRANYWLSQASISFAVRSRKELERIQAEEKLRQAEETFWFEAERGFPG